MRLPFEEIEYLLEHHRVKVGVVRLSGPRAGAFEGLRARRVGSSIIIERITPRVLRDARVDVVRVIELDPSAPSVHG